MKKYGSGHNEVLNSTLQVLAEHNVTSFAALRKMDPARIEMVTIMNYAVIF